MYIKIEDYKLEKKIGVGATGEVYSAIKEDTTTRYAIKVLNKAKMDQKERLFMKREIELLKKFNNENIITLHEVINTETRVYLILDYCNGGDLSQYIQYNILTELFTRRVLKQVINGLQSLYSADGMHRDIKLSNILLYFPTAENVAEKKPIIKIC